MTDLLSGMEIGEALGSGAFGDVFEGRDQAHGKVAVKILKRKAYWDENQWPEWKKRYLAEAANLSKARHENVVTVHHVVTSKDEETIYICMQFCAGGSLQTFYEQRPLTLNEVRSAGAGVLHGLMVLHSRGMLHRDIKPANVLLDDKGRALLGDFGLVTDEIVEGYASAVGYYDHLAFEYWHGAGTSERTDVWAVGATLFRLLVGAAWFDEAPRPKEVVAEGGYAQSLKWLPHIPRAWRRFIRKMMADEPSDRVQSAGEALKLLNRLPNEPNWTVDVTSDLIRWERRRGTRRIVVEWCREHRNHSWRAWSEPIGKGNTRTLDGSNGVVSKKDAIKGLEGFFEI